MKKQSREGASCQDPDRCKGGRLHANAWSVLGGADHAGLPTLFRVTRGAPACSPARRLQPGHGSKVLGELGTVTGRMGKAAGASRNPARQEVLAASKPQLPARSRSSPSRRPAHLGGELCSLTPHFHPVRRQDSPLAPSPAQTQSASRPSRPKAD